MSGLLTFQERHRDEESCILALADRRWPSGFACARCGHRRGYRHKARARVFECAACGRQESVTAGTIFHRTRTPLPKWFLAAWLMGRDKRGVSALFLARELGLRYETAWLMAHKLRHGLAERPDALLDGMVEVDESYYGGRGKPESRGRRDGQCQQEPARAGGGEGGGGAGQGGEGQRLRRRPGAACHPAPGQCRAARRLRAGRRDAGRAPADRRFQGLCRARRRLPAPAHRPRPRQERRDADADHPTSCSATSRPGSTAPAPCASAPSTCRAMAGNGPIASTAAGGSTTSATSS